MSEFEEALAARGISLATVSGDDAQASQRNAAFAKEVGNFGRRLKEGEIVAVNAHGDIHRLDPRTTGEAAPDIEARLTGLDRASLMNVADTKDVMQEAARASYADEARQWRDLNTPLAAVEQVIADALTGTMTGHEFAAALDKAGITIARAGAPDIKALDALRDEADLARLVAHTDEADIWAARNFVPEARRFDKVAEGDYAAVTRAGDVIRLNPTALDFEEAEQRLADVETRLPSIIEARAQKEIAREQKTEFWAEIRAENAETRAAANDAFEGERAFRRHVGAAEHGVEATIHTADDAIDAGMHAATRGMSGLAKAVEKALSTIFSFFGLGEPKLTPMQRELAAKAEEELAEARAWRAAERQNEAARDWEIFEKDRRQQQDEHERNLGYRERPGAGARARTILAGWTGTPAGRARTGRLPAPSKGCSRPRQNCSRARDEEAPATRAQTQERRERKWRADPPPDCAPLSTRRLPRVAATPDCGRSGRSAARLLRKFTVAADDAALARACRNAGYCRGQYARMAQPVVHRTPPPSDMALTIISIHNRIKTLLTYNVSNNMTEEISKPAAARPFTHTAYLFVRTGVRKGRVYGYWKDGGRFREGEEPFAFIDMLPRGGWDGRVRFVRLGDPPPENEPRAPIRPGAETADETGADDQSSD